MADLKISELPTASALTGTEQIPVTQGGQTRRAPASAFAGQVHTHTLSQITDAGTAAALDVPASAGAQASSTEVVRGDDPRLDGGGGAVYTDRGDVSGSASVDLDNNSEVVQSLRLTGNVTLAFTNVPSDYAVVTLLVQQDGVGGHTLSLGGPNVNLNGGDGSIAPDANARSIVTLVTDDGGSSFSVAVADPRPNQHVGYYWNPQADGAYYIAFDEPVTLDLGGVVQRGTGSLAYAKSTDGTTFTAASGSTGFAANDVLRVTVTGFSDWLTFTIPRTA